MTRFAPALALACLGCSVPSLDIEGKRCAEAEPLCAPGFRCDLGVCVAGLEPTACLSDGDCTGPCERGECDQGVCAIVAEGTPSTRQTDFDCMLGVCRSDGSVRDVVDALDAWEDGDECTIETCTSEGRVALPASDGVPCSFGGGRRCSGGRCVGCTATEQCFGLLECIAGQCQRENCGTLDGDGRPLKDNDETDANCGGPCVPCADGLACVMDGDCESRVCIGEVCRSSCLDGIKNGAESDVDCGGVDCQACLRGKRCAEDGDCASDRCEGICLQ